MARIAQTLEKNNCLRSTIIVAATASDPAPLQYLAPYSGVAMGEHFMANGLRVLIIYDDLIKHSVSYRHYLYYCVVHQVAKRIQGMFFIFMHVY